MEQNQDSTLDALKSLISFDVVRRIFFLASIAVSVMVGFGLYRWIDDPIFRPLPDYITDKNLQPIVQALDKSDINYRLNESNHTISVPVSDVSKARMALAHAGIHNDDGFSFSYLNDEGKIGGSQFLENARYLRALEADLASTISDIQGINAAKVHLAIPQRNIFADERSKPSASIIINFTPGYEGDKEKIRSIIQLVAASVPDLDPSRVVITNQYGHYLSAAGNENSLVNREHIDYQNNMQTYYEKKITSLISPIVGADKASISVNIAIDFTQLEEAKEEYNPEKVTLRSEQSVSDSSSSSGAAGGVPGALSNQPPADQAGQSDSAAPPAAGGGQNHSENIKNYEVSKSVQYVKTISPKIKTISVAVIVDDAVTYDEKTKKDIAKPLTKDKMNQLTELVKSAIGFDDKRGDRVTVINSGFLPEKIEPIAKTAFWQEPWFWEWGKHVAGIIVGFIFLLVIYKKFSADFMPSKDKKHIQATSSANGAVVTPEMLALKEEQLKILRELVAKEPNKVASVIKKWIEK